MRLFAAERFIIGFIIVLFLIDAALIAAKGIRVDYAGYLVCVLAGAGVFVLGQFYRISARDLRIASALIAGGLFILFTLAASVFNYAILPLSFPAIDQALIGADAMLGYNWAGFVEWAATYPWIGGALFAVYATSLPQILVIIIVLGFSGKDHQLQHFLLTGVMGASASILFWMFFPTFGAPAYQDLPAWIARTIPIALDMTYAREVARLATEGVEFISPRNVLGLISFPSFHTFIAAMCVWFVPRHAVMIAVILVLNILMLPAVLVQGGHHLSDIFGGLIAFAIICPTSGKLLAWLSARERNGALEAAPTEVVAAE